MPRSIRLAPAHRLLALFLAATLLPSATLVWLGWRLVQQDRQLERERVREALDLEGSKAAAAIERELGAIDRGLPALADPAGTPLSSDLAVAVRLTASGMATRTGAPLLFVPRPQPPARLENGPSRWAEGERAEFVDRNLSAAASAYRALAKSSEPDVRAGALIRLARVQRNAGRPDDALATYDAMAELTSASVNGDPADLIAHWARLDLLERLGRSDALRTGASALVADLRRGRWSLDRTTYLTFADTAARWAGRELEPAGAAFVLSEAVLTAWTAWRGGLAPGSIGGTRRLVRVGETPVLLVSREDSDGLLVFAATPEYLATAWRGIWPADGVAMTLDDEEGPAVGAAPIESAQFVSRPASETRLPWTVKVFAATTPEAIARSGASRRALLIGVLALLIVLLPATAYLVSRAVRRDLAVAKQQTDFVSAVSHEFRSPLTSLTHLTSLLRGELPLTDARRRQYYDTLGRETDRLRRFVETLLDFGRMQAGAARYRFTEIAPASFAQTVVDEFRTDASAEGHPVALRVDEGLPVVMADPEALGRALWNLLENAAKYSPAGAPIGVHLERDADRVAIRVEDRGCGIPLDEQPHVFQRFFRGDDATRSAIKGTGVGLAVVQHIVHAHGGDVRLESAPGAGSTFSLLLPAAGVAAPSALRAS